MIEAGINDGDTVVIKKTDTAENGKIVVAFTAQSGSNYAKSVVGTVSGTSISFGSDVVFRSANTSEFACVYDTNADKTVILYRESNIAGAGEGVAGAESAAGVAVEAPPV